MRNSGHSRTNRICFSRTHLAGTKKKHWLGDYPLILGYQIERAEERVEGTITLLRDGERGGEENKYSLELESHLPPFTSHSFLLLSPPQAKSSPPAFVSPQQEKPSFSATNFDSLLASLIDESDIPATASLSLPSEMDGNWEELGLGSLPWSLPWSLPCINWGPHWVRQPTPAEWDNILKKEHYNKAFNTRFDMPQDVERRVKEFYARYRESLSDLLEDDRFLY